MTWRILSFVGTVLLSFSVYGETKSFIYGALTFVVLAQLDVVQWKLEDKS